MYCKIDEIIAQAKVRLRLTDSVQPDMALETYIMEGASSLGSLDSFIKCQKKLDIIDGEVTLPRNYSEWVSLRINEPIIDEDSEDAPRANCRQILYVNSPFLRRSGCTDCDFDSYNLFTESCEIVGDKIIFHQDPGAEHVIFDYIGKWYTFDDAGVPCFLIDHRRALRAYACYAYSSSYPVTQFDKGGYNQMQIKDFEMEWKAQKSWVRGNSVRKDAVARRAEVMSIVNSVMTVKNPYKY